jgi:HSP20 family protein
MVVRWDPFRDLMSIQNELNRLFDRTMSGSGSEPQGDGRHELATASQRSWVPPLDVYEADDKIELSLDLPGIEPENVDVTVEDSTLTVSGSREFRADVDEDGFRRVERRYGSFARSLGLPATADAEHIDASFDKGVLTITIPKHEESKPKRIEIKASA